MTPSHPPLPPPFPPRSPPPPSSSLLLPLLILLSFLSPVSPSLRLLHLIELPSLDGVLTQHNVDGHSIARNVSRVVGVACRMGGACSSAAQSCLAAIGNVGMASWHDNGTQAPTTSIPPAAYIIRRGSPCRITKPAQTRPSLSGVEEGTWPHWVLLSMQCLSTCMLHIIIVAMYVEPPTSRQCGCL